MGPWHDGPSCVKNVSIICDEDFTHIISFEVEMSELHTVARCQSKIFENKFTMMMMMMMRD